jgi:small subunit ribosomal protein S6
VSSMEQWGKRKLAYPIAHFTEGYYVLGKFEFKPALCKELEASLQISEDILRYLLIRPGD